MKSNITLWKKSLLFDFDQFCKLSLDTISKTELWNIHEDLMPYLGVHTVNHSKLSSRNFRQANAGNCKASVHLFKTELLLPPHCSKRLTALRCVPCLSLAVQRLAQCLAHKRHSVKVCRMNKPLHEKHTGFLLSRHRTRPPGSQLSDTGPDKHKEDPFFLPSRHLVQVSRVPYEHNHKNKRQSTLPQSYWLVSLTHCPRLKTAASLSTITLWLKKRNVKQNLDNFFSIFKAWKIHKVKLHYIFHPLWFSLWYVYFAS